ncbi:MAG: T9SS type A sorting domain-containing protein [Bacteroidota bacterium]
MSGIWSHRDDGALKSIFATPLLGINLNSSPFILDELLSKIRNEYDLNNFAKVILLTDSDSLISKSDSEFLIQDYVANYSGKHPKFLTVNLLDNNIFTPSYITDNQIEYYGSGYFLKELAEQSNGIHVEKHLFDWKYISSLFSAYSVPILVNLNIDISVDGGSGQVFEIREINEFPDPNKPRFFLGKSDAERAMNFNISGRFEESDTDSSSQFDFIVPNDTTSTNKMVVSMLGYNNILDLFNESPIDTSEIVRLSLYYNLLTDYTALLALEPNDSLYFIRDPFDGGKLTHLNDQNSDDIDSTFILVYPNPFNSMATFQFHLKSPSIISAAIFNSLGQKVFEITDREYAPGVQTVIWNAKNNFGSTVSSGFYIFRAIITDQKTKKLKVCTLKLIYLK